MMVFVAIVQVPDSYICDFYVKTKALDEEIFAWNVRPR